MYVSMSTVLISLKITICSSNYLNFIMIENRPFDDLTGKDREEQMKLLQEMNPDFLKKIQDQEKIDRGLAMAGFNDSDLTSKADSFISRVTDTNGMNSVGVQQKDQQLAGNFPNPYNPAGLPDDVYQSIMRQYGKKGFGPYTTEDKIRVQNFYRGV